MSEANKAVIRRLFDDCLNRHDPSVYPELYSEVVYRAPALGELRGEEHLQFLKSLFAAFPDAHWNLEDQIAEGDKVVSRWSFAGTHHGTFLGIAPTEAQLVGGGICIDRIVEGKIVEEWEQWDTLGMMQQLGMVPVEVSISDTIAP
ncbi:MAG TPA: ester cyclase [Terriglobales bacterium]|jgi:predicted ester cyclase|nr:ester cyclase [Terriglobales bacterium]